jgi:hypothetical protein
MSDSVSAAPAAASRSRSAVAPRAARRNKAEREMRLSTGGASIADVAAPEREKRMRALHQESLVRPLPGPPAELLALEVGRLNEALRVSRAMANANLRGVDRVVKILREPGRTHGFAAAGRSQEAGPLRLAAPAINPLARPAPPFVRPQMAPQAIENAQNAPGNGAALRPLAGEGGAKRRMRAFPSPSTLTSRPETGKWRGTRLKSLDSRPKMAPARAGDEPARSPGRFRRIDRNIRHWESRHNTLVLYLAKVAENGAQGLVIVQRTADSAGRPAPGRPGRAARKMAPLAGADPAPNRDGGPFPPVTRSQP